MTLYICHDPQNFTAQIVNLNVWCQLKKKNHLGGYEKSQDATQNVTKKNISQIYAEVC